MRAVAIHSHRRPWCRVAVLGALVVGIAGCSADTTRFSDPGSNPFAASRGPAEYTGSVRGTSAVSSGVPAGQIAAQSLPPPPVASRPATVGASSAPGGVSGGGEGMGSYTPVPSRASAPAPREITASVTLPHPHPTANSANVHVVARGETLMSISRRYHKHVHEIAAANKIAPDTRLKIGERIVIPGVSIAKATAPAQPAPVVAAAPKAQPPHLAAPTHVAQAPAPAPKAAPTETASSANLAAAGPQATADAGANGSAAGMAGPAFRWPVRGRVITGFGPKPNGQQSDGIDLAVPEGTAVHAAEDGVVAYAGNELKGYGNLILIRHANGFVTAYAHASEILVKRNDTVHRGQVIAKSGQTGSVTSPQLHFEIRKGSAPVDPTQYLPSGA
jgi:murein DD-endopeptidase MepM/ murein hydrolase activator NlpD